MASISLPKKYHQLLPYNSIAAGFDRSDPIMAYYIRSFMVERGLEIDKTSAECKQFLMAMLDHLQNEKNNIRETIPDAETAREYFENYSVRHFKKADDYTKSNDNVKLSIKLFYTATLLFDVLDSLGEPSEELAKHKKYAKWKVAELKRISEGLPPLSNEPEPDMPPDDAGISTQMEETKIVDDPNHMSMNEAEEMMKASSLAKDGIQAISFDDKQTAIKKFREVLSILERKY
ncbi:hypothetical protein SNEBB_007104 [Seison nebaliae]|nr:hypothetical protein SNEBB_007104 [Seison nebaliae]